MTERTPDGSRRLDGATVELYLATLDADEVFEPMPVSRGRTAADGRYFLCLPAPRGNTGATGPDGQRFDLRVRKDGYRSAAQSFRFAYSVWDYGGVELNVELSRN